MTEEVKVEESLKFIWAYMIQEGGETNGEWNYYGSGWRPANPALLYQYEKLQEAQAKLQVKIKEVGIDWSKTKVPENSVNSCFDGTFVESSSVDSLLGKLVLKDGSEYLIGVSNAERRFGEHIKMLASLMEDRQRVKDLIGE